MEDTVSFSFLQEVNAYTQGWPESWLNLTRYAVLKDKACTFFWAFYDFKYVVQLSLSL